MAFIISRAAGIPIYYTEYAKGGSQEATYMNRKLRFPRVFTMVWEYHWLFIQDMIGYSFMAKKNGREYISRVTPRPMGFPNFHNRYWLWPRDVLRIEGMGGPKIWEPATQKGIYKEARVTLGYDAVPYSVREDNQIGFSQYEDGTVIPDESPLERYVTRGFAPSGEYLKLPRGAFRWVSDDAPANEPFGRVVNKVDFVYTWHEVPKLPASILTHVGKVNQYTFDGRPPGTMYLPAVEVVPFRNIVGMRVFDITYRMRYFQPEAGKGHNDFLRMKGNAVDPVWDRPAAGAKTIFEEASFADLFREPYIQGWDLF